jgi:hypothetical protein
MRTAHLEQIIRQKDSALLKAVEHLSKNETALGIQMLQQQGRVTEIVDPAQRIETIAKSYGARPENTIIVSPDNASRAETNQVVRRELQALGMVEGNAHSARVLEPRSDMTGADRGWAARYQTGETFHFSRGSKGFGIERGSYTRVVTTNPKENLITVRKPDGKQVTYDSRRLHGINGYRKVEREFAIRRPDSVHCSEPRVACRQPGPWHRTADRRRRQDERSYGRGARENHLF